MKQYTPPSLYLFSICLVYFSALPKRLIHPKNMLFAYCFIWYTIPIIYANRYRHFQFDSIEEVLSYCMLIFTFVLGYNCFHFFTKVRRNHVDRSWSLSVVNRTPFIYFAFLGIFLLFVGILGSGISSPLGIIGWLNSPGEAFMQREGSGVFTIGLVFATTLTFSTGAFYCYKMQRSLINFSVISFYFFLVFVSFLFLANRARMLQFVVFLFLPYFFRLKYKFRNIILFVALGVMIVVVASANKKFAKSSDTSKVIFENTLNYFDTYHALYKSVKYVNPSPFSTTLMAFNKFTSPFGNKENVHYSISGKLTPIFFPGYLRRTTVQFPIETDMYLSFYYVFGVPFLFLFFYLHAIAYRYALERGTLASLFLSTALIFNLMSNLRGMLINWTDLYFYVFLLINYCILNHREVNKINLF